MDLIVTFVQVISAVGAVFALYRLIVGPTLFDRAVSLDVILLLLASGVAAQGARSGEESFSPLLIVVALVAFLATSTVARYAEWRRDDEE